MLENGIVISLPRTRYKYPNMVKIEQNTDYSSRPLSSFLCFISRGTLLSFAAVIQVVTQCSSPTNGCSLELCFPFPLLLRTNNVHVTVSSYTNHISRYICRQRSRFPRNGSLLLIGQFKERNAALE